MPFDPQTGEDTSIRDSLAMRQLGTTVSPKDINKALKPYKLEDAKVKGKSDDELYNMAQRAVVKWWQRQQKQKINSNDKLSDKEQNQRENRVENKVEKALGKIPELNLRAEARREERAREARQRMNELLRGTGLRDVEPPTYAMTSVANLKAWINRQVARRNRLRRERERYLD